MVKAPQPFQPCSYILYQINDAGVPLVADREFLTLRTAVDMSANGKRKFVICSRSIEPEFPSPKKVVRANLYNLN